MDIREIEELVKTVNRNAIKALLRNAAIMKDPNASAEMRQQAEENVKAISYNKPAPHAVGAPATKKPAAAEQATQPAQQLQTQTPAAASPIKTNVKLKYSPAYQHYGVTEDMWHATPEAHQGLFQHHQEVMAGKHPDLMHIKTAVEQMKPKMMKSVDALYDLFSELKKHI